MKRALFFILIGILLTVTNFSWAKYPEKWITLVVPFQPGAATDLIARNLKKSLSETSNIRINIVNRPEEWGMVGMNFVQGSKPDGYTLGMHMNALGEIGALNITNYEPIAMIARLPLVAFVPAGSSIRILSDLKSHQTRRPLKIGSITFLSTTAGLKLAGLLNRKANIVPITFRQACDTTFIKNNDIDLLIAPPSLIGTGDLVPITVFSKQKFKEIPTASSQGLDIQASLNYAVVAPLKTPKDRIKIFDQALKNVINNPGFKKGVEALGGIGEYKEGIFYRESTQEGKNDFCTHCECDKSKECKEKCEKCK